MKRGLYKKGLEKKETGCSGFTKQHFNEYFLDGWHYHVVSGS